MSLIGFPSPKLRLVWNLALPFSKDWPLNIFSTFSLFRLPLMIIEIDTNSH